MNIIKIYNYLMYFTDSCYNYLFNNKKKNFYYKIYIVKKGCSMSMTKICYCKLKNNFFNKIIKIKETLIIIDMLSLCFLNNSLFHFNNKLIINSPNSCLNFFLENKILNKILYLLEYIINKKLKIHNGILKMDNFNMKKKTVYLLFLGNCTNCNLSIKTFNKFVLKVMKKIRLLKIIKLNE